MKIRLVLAFVLAAVVVTTTIACNDKPPMVPDQDQTPATTPDAAAD
jgi:hypothetical protein